MPSKVKKIMDAALKALAHTSNWPRTFRLIWQAAPRWTTLWAILLVVQGLLPAASVYLTKLSIDSLVAAMSAGGAWEKVRLAVIMLALTAGVMLLSELLQGVVELVRIAQSELIQDYIKDLVHKQAAALDMSFYESSEYHDRLHQALSEAGSRPLALLENSGSLVQSSITLIAMGTVLLSYSPLLPLILLISTLPAFFVVMRFDRRYHRWWQRTTADRRWAQYYDAVLTHSDAAAEVRLFNLSSHFRSTYQSLRRGLRNERLDQLRKQTLAKVGATATALIVVGATMGWMVWRALRGLATLGDLALFYQAFNQGQGLMRSLLGGVSQILANSLYLGNLFAFLDLKPCVASPTDSALAPASLKKGISFNRVTFRYPGNEKVAIEDFNLFIPANKIVAIVGPNGAGKTTLLKLLCRFYDPEAGSVDFDGEDLRRFAVNDLHRLVTVLFQFPVYYHATVRESIAMGDLESAPTAEEIEAAARRAGAHEIIEQLPQGYDTLLGKWFANGIELSGGERQRIAMARAYIKRSPIMILDEPTSFMDSWAESDWFDQFRALAQGRTSVIITHRFSIALRADLILVMDKGKIVESGTHNELLCREGMYARSWRAQMQAAGSNGMMDAAKGDLNIYNDAVLQEIQ
jgi:ATP-binding cassette subfamily B protein